MNITSTEVIGTNPTAARLAPAVADNPGQTSKQLAIIAGIGKSTAGKQLAAWEAQGIVRRDAEEIGKAAKWFAVDDAAAATADETADDDVVMAAEAAAAIADDEPAAPGLTNRATSDEPRIVQRAGDAAATEVPAATTTRLKPGGLRALVEGWLHDNPDTEITPSGLGKILDRSSGAVANALVALVDAEVAIQTCDRPKRYKLVKD